MCPCLRRVCVCVCVCASMFPATSHYQLLPEAFVSGRLRAPHYDVCDNRTDCQFIRVLCNIVVVHQMRGENEVTP